jgi:hypothetical protein
MSFNPTRISVSIAQTESEIDEALSFCRWVYERNYGTHWTVPPDLFFVAREDGEIVATGGLTFAALHPQIASERYFQLSEGMRQFIDFNRQHVAEFGRFASLRIQAAKAILHSALSYCSMAGVDFLFAWANPSVYKYTTDRLGLQFWPIAVALDLDNALSDKRWASPPAGFFQRNEPPALHLGVVPFWEKAKTSLAAQSGHVGTVPAWLAAGPVAMPAALMKPTSIAHSAPRLVRTDADVGGRPGVNGAFANPGAASGSSAQPSGKPAANKS